MTQVEKLEIISLHFTPELKDIDDIWALYRLKQQRVLTHHDPLSGRSLDYKDICSDMEKLDKLEARALKMQEQLLDMSGEDLLLVGEVRTIGKLNGNAPYSVGQRRP